MIVPLTTHNYKHKMGDTNSSTSDPPATKETPTKESYWWHVNKGGFPIPQHTWEKLWSHVIDVHPQGDSLVREIRGRPQKRPPTPTAPTLTQKSPVPESLQAVQSYMNELQYNHTGTQFFDIRKRGPLSRYVSRWCQSLSLFLYHYLGFTVYKLYSLLSQLATASLVYRL